MKYISLTQGKRAVVSDADFKRLAKYRWFATKGKDGNYYAARIVYLHRDVLGVRDSKTHVDHRDGDTLNDARKNLRRASCAQNGQNRKLQSNNTSGFKGIERHRGKWMVRIQAFRKRHCLGCYADRRTAAQVYDRAARRLHGEFARLNFPVKLNKKNQKKVK